MTEAGDLFRVSRGQSSSQINTIEAGDRFLARTFTASTPYLVSKERVQKDQDLKDFEQRFTVIKITFG